MKNKKLTSILYLLSGVLFFATAFMEESYIFIPIGCCSIVLGITNSHTKNDDSKQ